MLLVILLSLLTCYIKIFIQDIKSVNCLISFEEDFAVKVNTLLSDDGSSLIDNITEREDMYVIYHQLKHQIM